jgi:hypothetical protein
LPTVALWASLLNNPLPFLTAILDGHAADDDGCDGDGDDGGDVVVLPAADSFVSVMASPVGFASPDDDEADVSDDGEDAEAAHICGAVDVIVFSCNDDTGDGAWL